MVFTNQTIGPTRSRDAGVDPEAGEPADRLRPPGALVQIADLVAQQERRGEADEKGQNEGEHAADPLTGVPLHLLVVR